MTQVIAMWSGPRNLSTAMMRSFGARDDCSVMDEPFFAPYLQVTGIDHPGRDITLEKHETDPHKVAQTCVNPDTQTPYSFQKHMPHHMLPNFPLEWTKDAKHFFLIREPARVIASYVKGRASFDVADLGFAAQLKLYQTLETLTGTSPPIIDSADILGSPEPALRCLCEAIDIPFSAKMLAWEAGARPEDGAWAPYWYKSVERSTGFGPPPQTCPHLPQKYKPLLKACQTDYDYLAQRKLRINPRR